jgi:hypothetical protein
MSPRFELLCLANSRKLGGRCVAGLVTDGSGWVRPLGPTESGELNLQHRRLDDGSDPQLLNVISVPVTAHVPGPHQPENWSYAGGGWRLVRKASFASVRGMLESHIHDGSTLFGHTGDRIEYTTLESNPVAYSLALVMPPEVTWSVGASFTGRTQVRARFAWGGENNNLVVTDLDWIERLRSLGIGLHDNTALGLPRTQRFMLTISLGEPFDGYCYKLVAAVILIT